MRTQIVGKQKSLRRNYLSWYSQGGEYLLSAKNKFGTNLFRRLLRITKQDLVSGDSIIDITGGFGVDSLCILQEVQASVTHCEINGELSQVLHQHNFDALLGANNILYNLLQNGIEYLQETSDKYIRVGSISDPSRRR